MDATIEDSLNSIIDPALRDEPIDLSIPLDPETPAQKPRKQQRRITPGSAADFRRREANRLAAERSRSRASEKQIAVERAAKNLTDENARLREQIAKLEAKDGETAETKGGEVEDQDAAQSQGEKESQQDSHSRTILAALISGAGELNGADETEVGWMEGVKDLLSAKDAGRPGQSAKGGTRPIGALKDAGSGSTINGSSTQAATDPIVGQKMMATEQDIEVEEEFIEPFQYTADAASQAAASSVAVALNAEMEKLIRDDLAATKAAIALVEKQITRLGEGAEVEEQEVVHNLLPDDILIRDADALETDLLARQASFDKVEQALPRLRVMLDQARTQRLNEETKVAELLEDFQEVPPDAGVKEKEKVMHVLRTIGGYLGSILGGLGASANPPKRGLDFEAPYSSPAIARRRRGRPPKPTSAGTPAKPVTRNKRTDSSAIGTKSDLETPVPRRRRPPVPLSRLGREVQINPPQMDENDDEVADDTAEIILSHLASHVQAQEAEAQALAAAEAEALSRPGPLDSSSFVSLIPDSDGAEIDPALLESGTLAKSQAEESKAASDSQSVLSRLKKGPNGSCDICGRTETSVWRKLVLGGEDHKVCNACGLYHTKFGVIRPAELWGNGRGIKKRRSAQRGSTTFDGDELGETPKKKRKSGGGKGKAVDGSVDEVAGEAVDDIFAGPSGQEVDELDDGMVGGHLEMEGMIAEPGEGDFQVEL